MFVLPNSHNSTKILLKYCFPNVKLILFLFVETMRVCYRIVSANNKLRRGWALWMSCRFKKPQLLPCIEILALKCQKISSRLQNSTCCSDRSGCVDVVSRHHSNSDSSVLAFLDGSWHLKTGKNLRIRVLCGSCTARLTTFFSQDAHHDNVAKLKARRVPWEIRWSPQLYIEFSVEWFKNRRNYLYSIKK